MSEVCNFNAGPAMLPRAVLQRVQSELIDYHGKGMSIMEMSHRSKEYEAVNANAEATFKRLLGIDKDYRVLFVQGGASTQFAMVPMNFLPAGATADYLITGLWAEKAFEEAALLGKPTQAASTKEGGYRRMPTNEELRLTPNAAFVHYTTNETVQGTQFHAIPEVGDRPLVADMSSDIFSRPFDASKFSLIYAGAQKNLGPSGVTVVLLRESWLEKANKGVPTMLRYATHVKNNSLYNTPPSFGVYVLGLVLEWIE
ncbi:MAG: 3-phosphoserine/phosphohydroxythreonine transaminase, partial [Planctomycetota bacterium]